MSSISYGLCAVFYPLFRRDECIALGAVTRTELSTEEVLLSDASRPRDLLTLRRYLTF